MNRYTTHTSQSHGRNLQWKRYSKRFLLLVQGKHLVMMAWLIGLEIAIRAGQPLATYSISEVSLASTEAPSASRLKLHEHVSCRSRDHNQLMALMYPWAIHYLLQLYREQDLSCTGDYCLVLSAWQDFLRWQRSSGSAGLGSRRQIQHVILCK